MIIELLINCVFGFFNLIFSFLPPLPAFDSNIIDGINLGLKNLIDNGLGLFYIFVRPTTFKICLAILILFMSWDPMYHLILWVLKKIPFLNIK